MINRLVGALGHRSWDVPFGHGVILKVGVREGFLELKTLTMSLEEEES